MGLDHAKEKADRAMYEDKARRKRLPADSAVADGS
jgi:hypothetical protein